VHEKDPSTHLVWDQEGGEIPCPWHSKMKRSPFQTLIHLENAVQSSPDIQLCMGQGHDVLEQEHSIQ
jgi:hypothetical protein